MGRGGPTALRALRHDDDELWNICCPCVILLYSGGWIPVSKMSRSYLLQGTHGGPQQRKRIIFAVRSGWLSKDGPPTFLPNHLRCDNRVVLVCNGYTVYPKTRLFKGHYMRLSLFTLTIKVIIKIVGMFSLGAWRPGLKVKSNPYVPYISRARVPSTQKEQRSHNATFTNHIFVAKPKDLPTTIKTIINVNYFMSSFCNTYGKTYLTKYWSNNEFWKSPTNQPTKDNQIFDSGHSRFC